MPLSERDLNKPAPTKADLKKTASSEDRIKSEFKSKDTAQETRVDHRPTMTSFRELHKAVQSKPVQRVKDADAPINDSFEYRKSSVATVVDSDSSDSDDDVAPRRAPNADSSSDDDCLITGETLIARKTPG